jgi:hypothetical protein
MYLSVENIDRRIEIEKEHGDIEGQEWLYVNRRKDLDDARKGHRCKVLRVGTTKSVISEEVFDGHDGTVTEEKTIGNWQLKTKVVA